MLKMMAIADNRHFSYDNEIELVQFIASEMEKEGLDVNNEENLDSYLNTKFMYVPSRHMSAQFAAQHNSSDISYTPISAAIGL
jgi:hypothetical protein